MELHAAAAGQLEVVLSAVHTEVPAIPDGDNVEIRMPVIPAAGERGLLPTRDGRRQRVSDPHRLAAELNAQAVDVRIDFDHRSEPTSKTFKDSTAADGGWARDFRATASGAIDATLMLSAEAADALRKKKYRYLSPGLLGRRGTGEVVGMTSLALVNNPNMALGAPTVHNDMGNETEPTAGELNAQRGALKKRQEAFDERVLNSAEAAVDKAVEDKRLMPAQKDFVLHGIKTHEKGVEAGLAAFEKAYAADVVSVETNALDKRVGPRGAPRREADGQAPRFNSAPGYADVDEEQLDLHGKVADYARKRGISYREAVLEFGALR